ncbi:hypothetical protein [Cyanobium sp. Cruz-8H5]|uniref:DUF7680 family protein n=1 Tax=Cyanobium sp. Cruz-8H5 TaxID=2823712 RepID=UPI0020CD865D|nr:hypothetical protein [Cyanobium sp. Cruz-8H5]MCP9861399.1 hypothetical protein [Cyanobium sp. Cruz-8H5]
MSAPAMRLVPSTIRLADNLPLYELRVTAVTSSDMSVEVWQLPSPATPRLQQAELTATLAGRPWRLMEARVAKRLRQAGIQILHVRKGQPAKYPLTEDMALNLALLFRVLAPMRNIDRIQMVADGIDKMTREEAGYWLGMAVHRVYPRRVLAALRMLLTTP